MEEKKETERGRDALETGKVVNYLEKYLEKYNVNKDDKIITKTMINNYVKQGIMPAPEKKKYSKEHGIKTNVFWADYEEKARKFLDWGVECILTNDYNRISQIVEEYKK